MSTIIKHIVPCPCGKGHIHFADNSTGSPNYARLQNYTIDCDDCSRKYHLEAIRDRRNLRQKRTYDVYAVPNGRQLDHQLEDWTGETDDKFLRELMYVYTVDDLFTAIYEFGQVNGQVSKLTGFSGRIYNNVYRKLYGTSGRRIVNNEEFLEKLKYVIQMYILYDNEHEDQEYFLKSDYEKLKRESYNVSERMRK